MLAYTFYETDGRVMRYAEALVQSGATVDAIVLRRSMQPKEAVVNGVTVLRIQERVKDEAGKFRYLWRVLRFFVSSTIAVTKRHRRAPYDLVHVHSVPDFEVFAALWPKLTGARIILDIHDIVPEFFAAKFNAGVNSLIVRALKVVEKWSASFADHVIVANDLWLDTLTARAVSREKCSAMINYPDLAVFRPELRTRKADSSFMVVYPGTLNWHQGVDIAVRAVAKAAVAIPEIQLHIFGEGSAGTEIKQLIVSLRLADRVFLNPPLPQREIAAIMANADLGVVPKRNDSFGGDAFSTKVLEFMALGVPLVVADTRIDRFYFDDTLLSFFRAEDEDDLARAMVEASRARDRGQQLAQNALEFARRSSWNVKKDEYLALVNRLVSARAVVRPDAV